MHYWNIQTLLKLMLILDVTMCCTKAYILEVQTFNNLLFVQCRTWAWASLVCFQASHNRIPPVQHAQFQDRALWFSLSTCASDQRHAVISDMPQWQNHCICAVQIVLTSDSKWICKVDALSLTKHKVDLIGILTAYALARECFAELQFCTNYFAT